MPLITINMDRAIQDLQAGNPVAIPTETVYGLAAMINKPQAIKRVFEMKNRPLNHPLIVHVAPEWDITQLAAEVPDYAQLLINSFWPGALTLVFHRQKNQINPLITGGQSTIAIRSPSHPLTLKLLRKLDTPLVAPSANPFGKISPTTALHVKQSFKDQDLLILDGGRCAIGIESTIVDATHSENYQILRHGLIGEEEMNQVINNHQLNSTHSIRVPGALASHYQPQKTLYYFERYDTLASFCQKRAGTVYVIAQKKPEQVEEKYFHLLGDSPEQAAFDLYFQLRLADASDALCIAIELPPEQGKWRGIRERILKAGFPYTI